MLTACDGGVVLGLHRLHSTTSHTRFTNRHTHVHTHTHPVGSHVCAPALSPSELNPPSVPPLPTRHTLCVQASPQPKEPAAHLSPLHLLLLLLHRTPPAPSNRGQVFAHSHTALHLQAARPTLM